MRRMYGLASRGQSPPRILTQQRHLSTGNNDNDGDSEDDDDDDDDDDAVSAEDSELFEWVENLSVDDE